MKGPLKLLKDKDSGKIRMLMRRDKTLKVCVNFFVKSGTKVDLKLISLEPQNLKS